MQTLPAHDSTVSLLGLSFSRRYVRLAVPLLLLAIFLLDPAIRPAFYTALSDAYIAVGVFVALTLAMYYVVEKRLGLNADVMEAQSPMRQVVIASVLGALPGCGGAIIVVSQYAAGRVGFAALVAVLVSTMGDAAFLLLAKEPMIGGMVIVTGIVVGVISGWVVSAIHDPAYLKNARKTDIDTGCRPLPPYNPVVRNGWVLLLLAAVPLTFLSSFQVDVSPLTIFSQAINPTLTVGVLGAVACLFLWAVLPLHAPYQGLVAEDQIAAGSSDNQEKATTDVMSRVIHDTNFIMVWVTLAFLSFEVLVHYTGLDISKLFGAAAWMAPLIGVLIGFLPGCGPQIIVAGLYLQGVAPLSTLLGNAISNDGDALFPAIALAPKAAVMATIYSAVPAVIVGYAVFFITG